MLTFERRQVNMYTANTTNQGTVQIIENPFGNCQLFSVANAQAVLRMEDPLAEFINISNSCCSKNQMVIDVIDMLPFREKIHKMFKGYINKRHRYINTTGTPMIQYFIKIRQYIRDNPQPRS